MPRVVLKTGKGVNLDILPSELEPGVWSDLLNFRVQDGIDEKVGGIAQKFTTPTVTPYFMCLYITGQLVVAGIEKVFIDDGATSTEITRTSAPQVVASLTRTSNVATLTTVTPHGLSSGVTAEIYGVSGGGTSGLNTTAVITVTSPTAFTYPANGPNTSVSANRIGRVGYLISGASTIDFTGGVDDRWTGGFYNGVLVLNNPVDGLFYYDLTGTPQLRQFPSFNGTAVAARAFKDFIILLGYAEDGVSHPYGVRWPNAAESGSIPDEWAPASDNLAGGVDLADTPGVLVDCLPLGDVNIIYKQDARYAQQYLPGDAENVFAFSRLPGTDGLFARGCVVNTPLGHVFLTQSKDVKIHNGGEAKSIAEGRIRTLLNTIDATYGQRAFLAVNKHKSEVWVVFPTTGNSTCNKVAMWNWNEDTWGIRSVSNVTYGAWGLPPSSIADSERLFLCTSTPKVGLVDSGSTDFGATVTGTLERTGMDMGDTDAMKVARSARVQADATAGNTATVYLGSAKTTDAAPTYNSGRTMTVGTTNELKGAARAGRFLAVKLVTTAPDWKHRQVEIEFTPGGRY